MIRPGIYKHNPAGWRICVNGTDRGIARNPQTGERIELLDFIAWTYGISREDAILEILSINQNTSQS